MINQPQRTVENNVLISSDLPKMRLEVDHALPYIGRLQFILYDLADVDLFIFGEADQQTRMRRLLLVQFEQFLEGNDKTYNYRSPLRATVGEHEFIYDTSIVNMREFLEQVRPDSDSAQAMNFLREQGYRAFEDIVYVRFVRLLDEARRKELLFSYSEDLATLGLTAADLAEGGSAAGRRDEVSEWIVQRAMEVVRIAEG